MKSILTRAKTSTKSILNAPKNQQLRLCNVSLMIVAIFMLISSIQMEALAGDSLLGISFETLTFIHAGIGIIMFSLVAWHLYLHFGDFGWIQKLQKSPRLTKSLAIFGALTLSSGIFILAYMLTYFEHNLVGAIHGKIGFVFIALCGIHIYKYWAWIKRKIFNK